MNRFKKNNRRRKSNFIANAGYRSSASKRSGRSGSDVPVMRSRRKKSEFGAFIRRNYKIIAVAVFVIVVASLSLILFVGGKNTETAAQTPMEASATPDVPMVEDETISEFDEESEYSYEGVEDSILEGMAGTDESLFSEDTDAELADALFAEEGIRIGVTIGDLQSDYDQLLLSKLEEVSSIAEADKTVYEVYYYNANGNYNQQLQDMRSLIKNEVDVIIMGATDKNSAEMVTSMAAAEGILVVAYEASIDSGYAINIVADQVAWGKVYGQFMSDNLDAGIIAAVLGNSESDIDQARKTAMMNMLRAKEGIEMLDPVYAMWQEETAKEAMVEMLDEHDTIDGVITEEGMAEGIIDAFIEAEVLPGVMCGDATAGFIKKWYALRNGGIDVTPPPEDGEEVDETAPKIMFAAQPGEFVVCAQPAPVGIGAVAFEVALKLAEGRTLKTEGQTFEYAVETMITDQNLAQYYEQVKEKKDSYVVSNQVSEQVIESLFELQQEQ